MRYLPNDHSHAKQQSKGSNLTFLCLVGWSAVGLACDWTVKDQTEILMFICLLSPPFSTLADNTPDWPLVLALPLPLWVLLYREPQLIMHMQMSSHIQILRSFPNQCCPLTDRCLLPKNRRWDLSPSLIWSGEAAEYSANGKKQHTSFGSIRNFPTSRKYLLALQAFLGPRWQVMIDRCFPPTSFDPGNILSVPAVMESKWVQPVLFNLSTLVLL